MTEDMSLEELVSKGFLIKSPKGKDLWQLTPKGRLAFQELVKSNPKFYAKEFPDWIRIEWVN